MPAGPAGHPPDQPALLPPPVLPLLHPPYQKEHLHLSGHSAHQDYADQGLLLGKCRNLIKWHL